MLVASVKLSGSSDLDGQLRQSLTFGCSGISPLFLRLDCNKNVIVSEEYHRRQWLK